MREYLIAINSEASKKDWSKQRNKPWWLIPWISPLPLWVEHPDDELVDGKNFHRNTIKH